MILEKFSVLKKVKNLIFIFSVTSEIDCPIQRCNETDLFGCVFDSLLTSELVDCKDLRVTYFSVILSSVTVKFTTALSDLISKSTCVLLVQLSNKSL